MDDFLVNMITHIEQQYMDIERECLILRKLLKPWPKKKQTDQEKPVQVAKAEGQEKVENSHLTPSEKQALEEMDRLLLKAQKAIRIKEKGAITEKSTGADSTMNDLKHTGTNIKEVNENMENNEDSITCKKSATHSTEKVGDGNKRTGVKPRKKEIPLVKKNPVQTRVNSLSTAKDKKSSQHVSSSCLPSSRNTTPRPSSASISSSRPSSSRSRYTPAHINAPFKTDVNTRVPHRKHNHSYKNQLNKIPHKKNASAPVQKQQSHLNSLKTLPKISPAVQEGHPDISVAYIDEKETEGVDDTNCNRGIQSASVSDCSEILAQGMGDPEQEEFVDDKSKNGPKVSIHQQEKISDSKEEFSAMSEELFSLRDKSSKLKVPQRFHKLVAENHSLLEKCSTAKLVKKILNTDAALHFIERLNETNEVSEELWTKAKAVTCLQSHQLMLNSLNSLEIETLSEKSSFETVYRAKKLLEFILSKFAETQDEADYFSKVQFRPSPPCRMTSSTSPSSDKAVIESLFRNHVDLGTNDKFVMDALTSSKEWTRLQFEKNLHQLQLHLMRLSESEWDHVLSQEPENSGCFQQIHSLLTSSGEFFPAIVQNPYS